MLAARRGDKKQAEEYFQKAIDITPKMVVQLIHLLKRENVKYVVAPYEADAQLVYLEKHNIISGIISEDSDLLVFGARTLLTKMNQFGECVCVKRSEFPRCTELFLSDLTDAQLRAIAIFSGCDYSDGIPKVGIKIAHRFVRKFTTGERALRGIRYEGFSVPKGFEQVYEQAELTFLHQRVYSLKEQRLVMLNDPKGELDEKSLEYIGKDVEPMLAQAIAVGKVDPLTKENFTLSETTKAVVNNTILKTLSFNSQDITPRQQNQKITEFFKRASHANSAPTLPATRMSSNGISFKTDRFTINKKISNTSLIAKRIERVFEHTATGDNISTKKEENCEETEENEKGNFVSKFFDSIRKRPSIDTELEPVPPDLSDESGFDDSDFDPEDGFVSPKTNKCIGNDGLDKENSLDVITTPSTKKRKLSGSPFRQRTNQFLPSSSPFSSTKDINLKAKNTRVFDLKKFAYKPGATNSFSPDVAASFFGNSSSDEDDLSPLILAQESQPEKKHSKEKSDIFKHNKKKPVLGDSITSNCQTKPQIIDGSDCALEACPGLESENVSEEQVTTVTRTKLSAGLLGRLDRFRYNGSR